MIYPFEIKIGKKRFVKLHKDLYSGDLIDKVKKEIPGSVISCKSLKSYHILELSVDDGDDYFDFCNCLIHFNKSV